MRASACGVFEVTSRGAFLRLAPIAERSPQRARTVAELTAALAARGGPLAPPLPGASGFVAVTDTAVGQVQATLVKAAEGPSPDLEELSTEQVRCWGRAIAELHEAGRDVVASGLPTWDGLIAQAMEHVVDDPPLVAAVDRVRNQVAEVLGAPTVVGHGDPQPDNVAWGSDPFVLPCLFDLDDAALSWPLADLLMAVRDVQPLDALRRCATDSAVGQAVLRGYREVSPMECDIERAGALLQHGHAPLTYGRLVHALDRPRPDEPGWAVALRRRLSASAASLRVALLAAPVLEGPA